jgi:hypothetical protein
MPKRSQSGIHRTASRREHCTPQPGAPIPTFPLQVEGAELNLPKTTLCYLTNGAGSPPSRGRQWIATTAVCETVTHNAH